MNGITEVPACWAWPVTAADIDQARQAAGSRERERDRIVEELLVAWHAGRCAVCGSRRPRIGRGGLVWDHDHDTGNVRGLVCGSCNSREPHSRAPVFEGYRSRPPVAILGVSLFYALASSAAVICGPDAVEALQRWQEQNDPARRR